MIFNKVVNPNIILWRDGSYFIGFFNNNLANGWGKFYHYDSEIFRGEFVNNQANVYGEYVHKNGFINIGLWENDTQIGIGYEIMGDSCSYFGEFNNGKKNGKKMELVFINGVIIINMKEK